MSIRIPRISRPLTWMTAAGIISFAAWVWFVGGPIGWPGAVFDTPSAQVWIPIRPQVETVWMEGHQQGPQITGEAAILFENSTGAVLYAKNPHQTRAPASTTKILTAILTLERGNFDDIVTVSRRAASIRGSSARLYTGQKIRMKDLLHGLLILSGNDASVAIAEHLEGSEAAFVNLMNQRAADLGATRTRFQNPHGLDKPGHFSTAYDLALLARVALLYPAFGDIVRKRTYDYEDGTWYNTNKLLWRFEGAEGIKTGTTSQAGHCLVAAASQKGMQLISVVLDSHNRWNDSTKLLEYGFDQFNLLILAHRGDVLARFPLAGGMSPAVAIANRPLSLVVRDEDVSRITTQIDLEPQVRVPVRKGDTLGHFTIYVEGEPVKRIPLLSEADIHRRTPFRIVWDWMTRLFRRVPRAPSPP